MWFWLSLIALLCWSGSDLFSKIGCRDADDHLAHLKMVIAVGVVMGLHAAYEIFIGGVSVTWHVIWTYLPVSLLYIVSMALGYVGLRYIELSISSPICNASGAVVAVLYLCFGGLDEDLSGGMRVMVLLAIALMAMMGASVWNVIIALSIVYTPSMARIVRSRAMVVKEEPFVEALRVQGASTARIVWLHIVPNVMAPFLVQATFVFAEAVLSEAALSFLGLGIKAPDASWGNILQAGKNVMRKAPWMIFFPAIAIIASVLSLNLAGDGLRDALDPKTKED